MVVDQEYLFIIKILYLDKESEISLIQAFNHRLVCDCHISGIRAIFAQYFFETDFCCFPFDFLHFFLSINLTIPSS